MVSPKASVPLEVYEGARSELKALRAKVQRMQARLEEIEAAWAKASARAREIETENEQLRAQLEAAQLANTTFVGAFEEVVRLRGIIESARNIETARAQLGG